MKAFSILAILAVAHALAPQPQNAVKTDRSMKPWFAPVAAAAVGWTLATGVACANVDSPPAITSNSIVVSYEKLDMSMPSYGDSSSVGFGEGARSEAVGVKTGVLEEDLQKEAMRKAEVARRERVAAKKAEMKALEEESKARAQQKKEENAARVKELFN
mmetsp:Transcript_24799/g.36702  ORF Transcript_24799/g.36702 Transcript_24799/m.36702 type:complete len:159 (-) Transcript_24799:256-732(-)